MPKLFTAIRKWCKDRGVGFGPDSMEMPLGDDGKSKGYSILILLYAWAELNGYTYVSAFSSFPYLPQHRLKTPPSD